jgi:putative MFS transporter
MRKALNLTVLIAALGYFVDIFDLTIVGVVRISSLKDLGITDPAVITSHGVTLFNLQAFGMLVGGLFWGILGDKKGRLSVLFGSILLYSVANILNGFVVNFEQYAALRFLAGIGLAGELGAAVTLVSESLDIESRGYGTAIIATIGMMGAVAAALLGQLAPWKTAYMIGGCLGIALLVARLKMADSGMFGKIKGDSHRGDLRLLLTGERFSRYIFCVLAGVPIYFITAILFSFAPELSRSMGLEGITAGNALLYGTIGLTVGDLMTGLLSQWIKSRKRVLKYSLAVSAILMLIYFRSSGVSHNQFYTLCFFLGATAGYWAVLITVAAEQFGTNIRATVATSVPNFVRGSVILLTTGFSLLRIPFGLVNAALVEGLVVFGLAGLAIHFLNETYGQDLDYVETLAEGGLFARGIALPESSEILNSVEFPRT